MGRIQNTTRDSTLPLSLPGHPAVSERHDRGRRASSAYVPGVKNCEAKG
jgi:hypothetical protein